MHNPVQPIGEAYDLIAGNYDVQWSAHVRKPQLRLTRELALAAGECAADLGCGTGVDTVEMARCVAPGEVIGVDCSAGMLEAARRRAASAGLQITTACQTVEEFIERAGDARFDVLSLRFCLGYQNVRRALPRLPRLLREGGRVGILTILADSAPQAYATYTAMAADYGLAPVALSALQSLPELTAELHGAGLTVRRSWLHAFRLSFASGELLAHWLRTSGIAAAPQLSELPEELLDAAFGEFARRVEAYREEQGVPLDFRIAGVVAARS